MNEERNNQPQTAEPSLSEILQVRRDKLKALQDAGRNPFEQTRFARSAYSADIKEDFEAYDGKTLQAAGRIMSKRGMGKAIFCDIQDDRGQIQLYVRKDAVTEQEFSDFRKYDIGDIIGVSGYAFKTKTGEISIHVQQVTLLSKSLRPLPEKFHGMTNMELRYRQRYVDLIMNPEVRRIFEVRSRFIKFLRDYLDARYPGAFGHSLGHGVGLFIHEQPRVARGSTTVLVPGHVVTVEPGVYIPGLGGCRIEDMAIITSDGFIDPITAPKQLIEL